MAKTEVTGKQIKDASVDLTVDVTGTLPVANGGTGSTTLTLNNVLLGNGTGALQAVAAGTSGNILTSDGTTWSSAAPTTTPKVSTIKDTNGATAISVAATASAANYIAINNATSTGNPEIEATGSGSNVTLRLKTSNYGFVELYNTADSPVIRAGGPSANESLDLQAKGAGYVYLGGSDTNVNKLRFDGKPSGSGWVGLTVVGGDTNVHLNIEPYGTGKVYVSWDRVLTETATQTITNKRITARINSVASSATPSINTDVTDQFNITALATDVTSMTTNLTGTPTNGQMLTVRLKDDGTGRAITWGASFVSSIGTLLTTTVAGKTHLTRFLYDSAAGKWACIASDATGY